MSEVGVWKHGEMRFTCLSSKPTDMSMKCWVDAKDHGRTWVSKKNETPTMFIMRILTDMEKDGANIMPYLLAELEERT